jgi:transcriptional regulator with XRE-family HTH domain
MDIREILASNLRIARRAKGLSQEELAHRAEIDRTYVSALERSLYAVSIDVLARLARVLDVEAADLLRLQSAPAKKLGIEAGTSERKQMRQSSRRQD